MDSSIGHIAERFVIHFTAAAFGVLITSLFLRWWWRKLYWELDLKVQWVTFTVLCAIPTALIPPLREAFDVAAGGSALKSGFDIVSWILGAGGASYGVYRLLRR